MKRTIFTAALEVAVAQTNLEQIRVEVDALTVELFEAQRTLSRTQEEFNRVLSRVLDAEDETAIANVLVNEWLAGGGTGPHSAWPRVNTNTQEKL